MKLFQAGCVLMVVLLAGPGRLEAQPGAVARKIGLSPKEAAAVDAAIDAALREDQALGLAIGIIRDREIVYLKGYGHADHAKQRPVSEETLFRWASCAKPLAAITAMQLVEQGRLDLDADVRKYVPEFPEKDWPITSRDLLCHQSGIPHYSNGTILPTHRKYDTPHPFENPVHALDRFNRSPLLYEPGTRESYSSYAYILMSAVVQQAGGEPFPQQVRTRISERCGATTLQPDFESVKLPHRTQGVRKVAGVIVPSSRADVGWKHGAGGYTSSIGDFAKFAQGLIRREFVSEQSEAKLWTLQKSKDGSPTQFGLGFVVEEQNGPLKISHNGKQDETRTRFVIYPTAGHGMVVMCNSEWADPGRYSTLAYRALQQSAKPE